MPRKSLLPWRRPPAHAWSRYPLLPPALALALGILCARLVNYPSDVYISVGLFVLVALGVGSSRFTVKTRTSRHLLAIPVLLAFVLLGFWRAGNTEPLHKSDHFSNYLREDGIFQVRIFNLRPGENSLRAQVEIEGIVLNDQLQRTSGRALVYLLPSTASSNLEMGDQILLKADFKPIQPPLNPGSFDFRKYWSFTGSAKPQLDHARWTA